MTVASSPNTVNIKPLIGQANLLCDFEATTLAAIAGTGGGKTQLVYWWLHQRMEMFPGFTWGLAEPTYNMLAKLITTSPDPERPDIIEYFRRAGHKPHYHAVDKILETAYGMIYLGSADNPNSMQGAPVKGYALDEAGLMSYIAYLTALQRVAMYDGQVLLATTPYNMGWLKTDIFDKSGDPAVHVEQWRSIDRPGFPRARYEEMKRIMPSHRFGMMFDALFERPAGLVYDNFDDNCIQEPHPIDKSWLIYSGHDFGIANPAAMFYAVDPGTGYIFPYHEYLPGSGRSVAEHSQEFKRITEGYNVIESRGGSHQEEEIRQAYAAHGWPILEPKDNRVASQILKVYGLHALKKVKPMRNLRNYLDELHSFSHELGDDGSVLEKIADEQRFHLMAADRYLLSCFTPETVVRNAIKVKRL